MMTPNPQELFTPFLPSTFNIPEEEDRLKTFLGEKFSQFSDVINDKRIGAYTSYVSSQNGEKWGYLSTKVVRDGYQAIAYIPSLPASGVLTIPSPVNDVNPQFVITKLFGTASKPCSKVGAGDGNYFMYNCEGDTRITFTFSDTTIVITTTTDLSGYSGFIVCEFLRNGA